MDWKRYEEAKRLRASGLTLKATGAALGISGSRVLEMLRKLERHEWQLAREAANPRLIPWWNGLKYSTAQKLQDRGFTSREDCMRLAADELTMYYGAVALPGWEEDRCGYWERSDRKLKLTLVNEVRAWLGVAPYTPRPHVASAAELERARRLLERNGWQVKPPNRGN